MRVISQPNPWRVNVLITCRERWIKGRREIHGMRNGFEGIT
jgi:hypothetical protein